MLHVERLEESAAAILRYASSRGVEALPGVDEKLTLFVDALLRWNTKHNLISRVDTQSVWTKHILHSIGILFLVPLPDRFTFIDIGTGGGLPGIPLAILKPESRGILIESIGKKAAAVKSIADECGITNVKVVHGRVEDPLVLKPLRRSGDVVFVRAVAPLVKLAGWSLPLLKPALGGSRTKPVHSLIALKGGDLREEVNDLLAVYPYVNVDIRDMNFGEESTLVDKKIVTVIFPGTV